MDLATIASLPEVKSVLLCDPSGALLGAAREPDAESAAAVTGFLATGLGQVGEELGLGALHRLSVVGRSRALLLVAVREGILQAAIEPGAAMPATEQMIDSILRR